MPAEFESGFFGNNVAAWHGLGTVIAEDVVTTEEALRLSGLDWNVSKQPIYLADGREIPNSRAITRDTDGAVLGVVGEDYRPVANSEAFAFVDHLFKSEEAKWHTAG